MTRGHRLRPLFDDHHEPCLVADLLTPEECHDRRWGIPPRRELIEGDPGLVAEVAALQARAS